MIIREKVLNIQIEKRPDESPIDYHKRIVYGKLVDKTLADMDYTELSEMIYGKAYSSDVARRMMYGSRETLKLLDSETINKVENRDIIKDIDAKMDELKKERQKFFDQRREYNKLISADGRAEHLYERLEEAANNLPNTVGEIFTNTLPYSDYKTNIDNEAVIVFSDWHYGMTASNVFNTYNKDICKQRVCSIVKSASERLKLHRCSKLHVVILGDMFHGSIHTGVRVASEELVCDQIMQVSEILAQSIMALSEIVDFTFVYYTYGNHGRTIQNKKDSIHRDNIERLVPWWLNQRLSHKDNVVFVPEENTEFVFINAAGHEMCATHGDLDSVKSSPRLLTTLFNKQYGKNIECILLGDKHHRESFEELGVVSMICGSLCGSDDYANDKRLFSSPSQLMLIVNSDVGIDAEYRLSC